jgi:hypothetical protein
MFGNGQGILVTTVGQGSPAEKAGIRPYDILMTYGDQKLFSPEQLAKLVKADKVGREVTLSLVRQGKVEQVTATLAKYEPHSANRPKSHFPDLWHWNWHMPEWFTYPKASHENDNHWQSFDSMTVKKLGDDRFKAEIQYMDQNGKLQQQQFEGTRDEIREAINARKDLPATEREHLLHSMDMPGGEFGFPGVHVVPGHGFVWDFNHSDSIF